MALRGVNVILKPSVRNVVPCMKLHEINNDDFVKRPKLSDAKKGRGGRSSFSGVVATVFGCNGLLGSNLVNQFGKTGTQMICPHRCPVDMVGHLKPLGDLGQIILTEIDFKDDDMLRRVMQYSNVVVNCIGKQFSAKTERVAQANVNLARRIARIAKELEVERFIHISHLNVGIDFKPVYKRNGSEYMRTKTLGEAAVREEFPDATIIRPATIFALEKDKLFDYFGNPYRCTPYSMGIHNKGEGVFIQPVYVGDVVRGIEKVIHIAETKGKIIEAVGPRRYELVEICKYFLRVNGQFANDDTPITDVKRDWLTLLMMKYYEYAGRSGGYGMSYEDLELETHSHITQGHETLVDYGIKLRKMEDLAEQALEIYDSYEFYKDDNRHFKSRFYKPKFTVPHFPV